MSADHMSEAADAFARAVALRDAGRDREAAAAFLMAFAMAPHKGAYRSGAFDVLNVMSGYRTLPAAVMNALHQCVDDPALDLQPLSQVVRNLMEAEPRLPALTDAIARDDAAAEQALSTAEWLLADPLVIGVLGRAVNISPALERTFTAIRRHVCLQTARRTPTLMRDRFSAALLALTAQCITNRYAWVESPAETEALERLLARTDTDALVCRAAYRPLRDIAAQDAAGLPQPLADAWKAEADEAARAEAMPALTPLAPGLSSAMRGQYERFPYPRWRHLAAPARRTLLHMVRQAMPYETFDDAPAGKVDVLVAGCGTCQPALTLAMGLTDARVLAVDLSRTSLAYGARQAAHLNADNISFAVADILNLGDMDRRFDFIDCSGVLHHMSDPGAGLGILRRLLRPHGIMMIGLYSARGRRGDVAAQAFVRNAGFAETDAGLQQARAALMALPADHPARAVVDTPDFFTRDGLHDLIFNVHESRTSPAEVKQLLGRHGLRALGVDVPPQLGGTLFRRRHPEPAAWADLDLWEAFEADHPSVFAHMIRVWCRPG